jgi:hypothetical protein
VQVINAATFIKPSKKPSRPSAEPEGLLSPPFVQRQRQQTSHVTPGTMADTCPHGPCLHHREASWA